MKIKCDVYCLDKDGNMDFTGEPVYFQFRIFKMEQFWLKDELMMDWQETLEINVSEPYEYEAGMIFYYTWMGVTWQFDTKTDTISITNMVLDI